MLKLVLAKIKHQRTVKDDNMMREGLMQPRDERRGRGQTRQGVLLHWAVREPRRSRRTRREFNYCVFASRGSEIGALASTSNQSLSRSKEQQITKCSSKRTKEPAETVKGHVQRVNVKSLHNQELQISARTEAKAKKKKRRKRELAFMKAEIQRIKEEQESINLKLSAAGREEELKEIAERRKELHILTNNIISLTEEHKKLMLMTKAQIHGEVLEVSSAGQVVITSGEIIHVQEVSSSKHQVLKEVVASPEVVSTSQPAALEEDRLVLPDLNDPLF